MAPTSQQATKRVAGYDYLPMRRKMRLVTEEYEYELPFNYPNVTVDRRHYHGGEPHGMETLAINALEGTKGFGPTPADAVVIEEKEHPIIRVAVIGSACTPPGYVQVEGEPVKNWRLRRAHELESVMPVRMRINGLWGMHLRYDQWHTESEVQIASEHGPYEKFPRPCGDPRCQCAPGVKHPPFGSIKMDYRELPLTGMSCAIFELPPCRKVIVMAGGEIPGWRSDNHPGDNHYSLRIIRTTVQINRKC